MSNFKIFADLVNAQFNAMAKGSELFKTDATDLYDAYLGSFPEGTNPIFRERTEHDCNTCKNFIRNLGNVVALRGGKVVTVWDVTGVPAPYDVVAEKLREVVANSTITSVFRTKEGKYGNKSTREAAASIVWNHFYADVPRKYVSSSPDAERGRINTMAQVFKRGLDEIRLDDLDTVLDLVAQKSLYRGEEFKPALVEFRKMAVEYKSSGNPGIFAWENVHSKAAGFRNTVIGTLLTDLASGDDIETAVRKFEQKVAPTNYKRPTALITPKMIEQAVFQLKKLDLEDAIERRFAKIEDVSVNDVLFVDNSVAGKMKGGLTDLLMESVAPAKVDPKKATPITVEDFMAMAPKSVSLILNNQHLSNFVSITAPVHQEVKPLFKWRNNFAWSYDGEVTDSIKEKVKKAGGNVTNATLRCSLEWFNYDDLDIHCHDPRGNHIYFGNKSQVLDVDMNAGSGRTREPVENLSWRTIQDGTYKISVNQFHKRENENVGFNLEVEFEGRTHSFTYDKAVMGTIYALDLVITGGKLSEIKTHGGIKGGVELSTEKWGVPTNVPVKVNTIMLSPNHWENSGEVGNKHWFFILDKCQNPEPVRGIYNEFLTGELEPHRKVFEVLGSKTKCAPTPDQLSGVGFSSTRNDKVLAIADGRTYEVAF